MKKFLSLVLALVMAMSLVTISAGAVDFTDDSDIDYKEAVDVISALGIVDGYSDGSFRPDGSLTRGAAAKIICNLVLGPTTASALSASTAPFKDVPTTNTFAGYITYCAQRGIISGYGDGTFRPTGTLTGNAFMKMLLGALGYDSSIEGYTGANWQVNVIKQAVGIGLDDGNDDFVGSRTVTRQEAALYAFNMLQATMVKYDQKSTIVVGGVEINTTSTREDETFPSVGAGADGNIDRDGKVQFAERYFTSLKATPAADEFQRPATTWRYDNRTVGTYTNEADLTYTSKVELGDIYSDLGLSRSTYTTEYYEDGYGLSDIEIARRDETKIGGNGVLTQVWYDEDEDGDVVDFIISHVNTYVAEVSSISNANSDDRTITLATKSTRSNLDNRFETQDFATGDLVAYTAAYSNGTYEIQTVEDLELSDTGVLTEWNGINTGDSTSNFTVGGAKYNYNPKAYIDVDGTSGAISDFEVDESELNVYLDQYGYALYVAGTEAEKNYAVVIGVGSTNPYGNETNGVTLMMPDGTRKEVTAKMDDWADLTYVSGENLVSDYVGDIVTYKVDDDDVYELTVAGDTGVQKQATGNSGANANTARTQNANEVQFVNGRSLFVLDDGANGVSPDPINLFATEDTIFVVGTWKDTSNQSKGYNYDVYVGYENMPSIDTTVKTDAVAYVTNSEYSTQLDVVYIATKQLAGISAVDTYFVKEKNEDIITNSQGSYYVLPAIVDGEETEVKVDATFSAVDNNSTEYGLFAITNVVTDKNGIITSFTDVTNNSTFDAVVNGVVASTLNNTTSSIAGIVRANGGVIGIGNSGNKNTAEYYAYNDDTAAYYVDKDYKDIQIVTITSLTNDDNDLVYGIEDDTVNYKKLDTIVVVEQEDVVKSSDTSVGGFQIKGVNATKTGATTYEITLDAAVAAGSATIGAMVPTTPANGATVTNVEWRHGDASTDWDNFNSNWSNNVSINTGVWAEADGVELKVTVTAADGVSTTDYIIKVNQPVTYYTLTIKTNVAGKAAMVSVDGAAPVMITDSANTSMKVTNGSTIAVTELSGGTTVTAATAGGAEGALWNVSGAENTWTLRGASSAPTVTLTIT